MISIVLDVVGAALPVIGLTLMTISLYGVLRMPDTYSQLHAQGLATGPGVITVLASSVATENAAIITSAADELGLRHLNLPSGAGHDAQELAHIAPMGMIFVPSVDGISHSPRERRRPGDIASGADVLLQAVLRLDQGALDGSS